MYNNPTSQLLLVSDHKYVHFLHRSVLNADAFCHKSKRLFAVYYMFLLILLLYFLQAQYLCVLCTSVIIILIWWCHFLRHSIKLLALFSVDISSHAAIGSGCGKERAWEKCGRIWLISLYSERVLRIMTAECLFAGATSVRELDE